MLDSIFNFKRLDVAKLDFYAIYKNYPYQFFLNHK